MSAHTPAPWKLVAMTRGKHAGSIGIKPIDDAAPAFAFLPRGESDIQEANARLIAAAPTLLEACLATEAALRIYGFGPGGAAEKDGTMKLLRDAIAKATKP